MRAKRAVRTSEWASPLRVVFIDILPRVVWRDVVWRSDGTARRLKAEMVAQNDGGKGGIMAVQAF